MSSSHRSAKQPGILAQLRDSFWGPPDMTCPKCRGVVVEYYDPFFFSPLRTLKGRRRLKCQTCGFIWRPSRKGRSVWDSIRGQF